MANARKVAFSFLTVALSALVLVLMAHTRPASALDIIGKGDIIFLGGKIKPGDSVEFANFIKAAPKGTYHSVYLASGGGFIVEAIDIGRIIRQEGLATIVDASKAFCASACTAIFASGVKRVYLNASALADGVSTKTLSGLGFHDGSNTQSLDSNHYSGAASALMINAYYEFGVPRAAEVITKAPPDHIFQLSGQTALQLGIATSLGKS
jgi:hypothetical protein